MFQIRLLNEKKTILRFKRYNFSFKSIHKFQKIVLDTIDVRQSARNLKSFQPRLPQRYSS